MSNARALLATNLPAAQKGVSKSTWVVPSLLWLLGAVAVLSAVYRLVVTAGALSTGASDPAEAHYAQHPLITALHLLPGITFMAVGPLQFITGLRRRRPKLHRWMGRAFVASGLIISVTGIVMNQIFPPAGGLGKATAIFAMSLTLFVTLAIALQAAISGNFARHRAFMVRAFAVGLSVATQRLFFVPYVVAYGMPNDAVIGVVMWLGLSVNVVVAELVVSRGPVDLALPIRRP